MTRSDPARTLAWDMLVFVPSWLLFVAIEPLIATIVGLPAAAALIAARRTWWIDAPGRGRLCAAVLHVVLTASVAGLLAFGRLGLVAGLLSAASLLAVVEGWNRGRGRSSLRRYPVSTVIIFLLLSAILNAIYLERGLTTFPTEEFTKVFSSAPAAPSWSSRARKEAIQVVRTVVDPGWSEGSSAGDLARVARLLRVSLAPGADAVIGAKAPGDVHVTLYDSRGMVSRGTSAAGSGDGLDKLISAAMTAASSPSRRLSNDSSGTPLWRNFAKPPRVQIDVEGERRALHFRPVFAVVAPLVRLGAKELRGVLPLELLLSLASSVEVGVDGVAFTLPDGRESTILPADPVVFGWLTPRVTSNAAKIGAMMRRAARAQTKEELDLGGVDRLRTFRTTSFGQLEPGSEVRSFYRGNILSPELLSQERLVKGIADAVEWLARQVIVEARGGDHQIGRFRYESYAPYRVRTTGYNLPRHAGAILGLLAAHRAGLEDPRLRESGDSAVTAALVAWGYVDDSLGSPAGDESGRALCFLEKDNDATSGATALAALALLEMPTPGELSAKVDRDRLAAIAVEERLRGMGACLLEMIDGDGAVFRSYSEARGNETVDVEPLYFPGEVMLALVRMHARLGDPLYVEAARRIGDRQLRLRRVELALGLPIPGDHWMTQAAAELARAVEDLRYARLSLHFGKGMLRELYPPQEFSYPDYRGAYRRVGDVPRTTRAASRGEALGAALDAARYLGEPTADIESALIAGARHLLEQQFTDHSSYFVPESFDVHGAIRMGLVDNHCRIDNNQHAIIALLHALELLRDRSS